MDAIVLAGGLGTRLQGVVQGVPKPMAPINDKPFLIYLIQYLYQQGISKIILSTHHLSFVIEKYFREQPSPFDVICNVERKALGTGGAIRNVIHNHKLNEPFFVINGDTFVELDYQAMYRQHLLQHAKLTIALQHVENCHRYGKVIFDERCIKSFIEKGQVGDGWINAGIYLMHADVFEKHSLPECFSIETDFFLPFLKHLKPAYFLTKNYFIDIGVPEDYQRSQHEIPMKLCLA